MVWACFSWNGQSGLVFIPGTMDSSRYCAVLDTYMQPFMESKHPNRAIFQHDNASCHSSVYTTEWLSDMDVNVLEWPVRTPDQCPIANLWAIYGQFVFKNTRQFEDINYLKEAYTIAWDEIELSTL